jgi:hypothetical protein
MSKRHTTVLHEDFYKLLKKKRQRPKIVLFCYEGFLKAPDGSGANVHIERLVENVTIAAKKTGYNLVLANEYDLRSIELNKEDRVLGLTLNGLWAGGYTVNGQGIKFENLMILADKSKDLEKKPIVGGSLHSSEFRLYGNPEPHELKMLKNIEFSPVHEIGFDVIKEKRLEYTSKTFPIPMPQEVEVINERTATNNKTILLQLDTQVRKNGEYSLAMAIDAFHKAKKKNSKLEVNIICKSSVEHSYPNERWLRDLISGMGLFYPNPAKGLTVSLQRFTSKEEWIKTKQNTDIFLGLSLEEGAFLFIPELWCMGAICFITNPGPCSTFRKLGEGIVDVKSNKIPSPGTGSYNDLSKTYVYFPNYKDTVEKLAATLLKPIHIKERYSKLNKNEIIDTDGESFIDFLKLEAYEGDDD